MIKIITQGRIIHKAECERCGCVFEFDARDVTKENQYDKGIKFAEWYFIGCPFCNENRISLYAEDFNDSEKKLVNVEDIFWGEWYV